MNRLKFIHRTSFGALAALLCHCACADTVTTPLRTFGHLPLVKMAVAPDGKHFVTAGGDGGGLTRLLIWDVASGEVIRYLAEEQIDWTTAWYGLAYSPDGKFIAASSPDTQTAMRVRVWDANSGELRQTLSAPVNFHITGGSTTFSPDGKQLAQGGNGFVRIWDLSTGKVLRDLRGVTGTSLQIAFSADGALLSATGDGTGKTAGLWELNTGRLAWTLSDRVHGDPVFTPDGKNVLLHFDFQGTVRDRLLNVKDGSLVREIFNPGDHSTTAAVSPDGQFVVNGGWPGDSEVVDELAPGFVRLWDANTGQLLRSLEGLTREILKVAFLPDGIRILTASLDQSVRLWNAKTGALLRSYEGHMSGALSLAWLPDGRRFATASDKDAVRIWDAQTGNLLRTAVRTGLGVALSPAANLVAFKTRSGDIEFWDIAKGNLRATYGIEDGAPRVLAFSPDGKSFAVGDGVTLAAPLLFRESKTETIIVTTESGCCGNRNPFPVYLAAFSSDGQRLFAASKHEMLPATGTYFNSALLWNLDPASNWPPQQIVDSLFDVVDAVAFSLDGTRLALITHQNIPPWHTELRVWDLNTRQETLTFPDIRGPVTFSPDGKWLLTGQYDFSTAQLWDAQSGRLLRELHGTGAITQVAFSPDGCQALVGSGGMATLWDLRDLRANLRMDVESGKAVVRWETGELQSAESVDGLWTTIDDATSPYVLSSTAPAKLFRVRVIRLQGE